MTSFEEVCAEMERQEALKLLMLCTMSTDEQGQRAEGSKLHVKGI
jgi:hypothetical protein